MNLVVNRSKERKNKFRKKVENGDVCSLESYYECVMFQLPGLAKLEFQTDSTRAKSVHDTNLNEIRDLLLSMLGKKITVPKIIKVKNSPFIRRIVHIHISDVPSALNANTLYSVGGSKSLIAGLAIGETRCVRVDKEIDECGQLPFKLLTVPYTKAAELSHIIPEITEASLNAKDGQREPVSSEASETSESRGNGHGGLSAGGPAGEHQRAAHDLAQYVLSPAQLHLWGYPTTPSACGVTAAAAAVTRTVTSDAGVDEDSAIDEAAAGKRRQQEAQTGANKRAKIESSDVSISHVTCIPAYVRGDAKEFLPSSHEQAEHILNMAGLRAVDSTADLDIQFNTLPYDCAVSRALQSGVASYVASAVIGRPLVAAVDCEMCLTSLGSELTRVSVLAYDGSLLLDTLVKPSRPIIDYRTPFSGITEELLKDVSTTLLQVQVAIMRLISAETIMIGHSLDSDLRALRICHMRCIDTAIAFPHPRGYPLRLKLRKLAEDYLQLRIQTNTGGTGHDSTEDAKAALQLAMLKVANGPLFGVKKPDQQRCSVLGVLDPTATEAVLLWQGEGRGRSKAKAVNDQVDIDNADTITVGAVEVVTLSERVVEVADVAKESDAQQIVISTAEVADQQQIVRDDGGNIAHLAEMCVGGNAISRHVSTSWGVVSELCAEMRARHSTCFSVSTTDDKSAGPVASWVTASNNVNVVAPEHERLNVSDTEESSRPLLIPKCSYFFGNITHPNRASVMDGASARTGAETEKQCVLGEEDKEFSCAIRAQIEKIRSACTEQTGNLHVGPGNTLLLVTAQDSLEPVLSMLQRKRALSRATMATMMWSADDELRLRELRKHNVAYFSACVL